VSTTEITRTDDFARSAASHHLYALWEMTTLHQTGEPQTAPACHWPWSALQPLLDQAVRETTLRNAERRVLLLGDPAFANAARDPHVTPVLQAGLQMLMPGESARPHRHTPNALRFVIEDGGDTCTEVDGKPCRMERGDVILTPAYTWHGHFHRGASRSVWVDVLDSQLCNYLDAGFFDPASKLDGAMPCTVADAAFVEPGYAPLLPDAVASGYSPRFRFAWQATLAALDAAPPQPDGSVAVRLTNPAGDGAAMPGMDCCMVRISRQPTRAVRSTASGICIVGAGSGVSSFGGQQLRWSENDIFTLPHWTWTSHRAESDHAVLFIVSDADVQRRLGLLRHESA